MGHWVQGIKVEAALLNNNVVDTLYFDQPSSTLIGSPSAGQLIYFTGSNIPYFKYYNGSDWIDVI